jgi:peroxiredoxin
MFRKKREMLAVGAKTPAFELAALDKGSESLAAILQKGPALLAFFKTSCPVCQLTFPYLQRMAASTSVRIVGISQDDANTTKGFNRRFGVTFETLLDESKAGYPVSNEFGIGVVPSIFLVEQDGTISKAFSGFSKRDMQAVGERAGVQPFSPGENVPEMRPG